MVMKSRGAHTAAKMFKRHQNRAGPLISKHSSKCVVNITFNNCSNYFHYLGIIKYAGNPRYVHKSLALVTLGNAIKLSVLTKTVT